MRNLKGGVSERVSGEGGGRDVPVLEVDRGTIVKPELGVFEDGFPVADAPL